MRPLIAISVYIAGSKMRDERMVIKNVLKLPQTNNKKKIREKHSRN